MEQNDVYKLLDQVVDRDSFIEFVKALAEERKLAQQIEMDNPQTYIIDGALDWSDADISSFLYAALAYFQGGMFHTPGEHLSF